MGFIKIIQYITIVMWAFADIRATIKQKYGTIDKSYTFRSINVRHYDKHLHID